MITCVGSSTSISGSRSYDGENVKSETTTIEIHGSDSATVYATDFLDVTIDGSGSVYYLRVLKILFFGSGFGSINSID